MNNMGGAGVQKVCVIVNPFSGVRRKGLADFRALLEQGIDAERFRPEIMMTEYAGHAAQIAVGALLDGVRQFIVVGGDGTVNEVAGVLAGSDARMAILPAGSGNGLAHHLEIPVKLKQAMAVFNGQKVLRIDTCNVNDRFFVSIAGIGFDARVARRFAKSNRRGFLTYARIVVREYFTYTPRKFKLVLDGKHIKSSAFFISFANSNQFGYNTRIAPNASLTDGLFDVCIVSKPPVKAFPHILHLLLRRKADRSKYMETYQCREARVKRKKGKSVNVDGEALRMGKELTFSIQARNLNVIIP